MSGRDPLGTVIQQVHEGLQGVLPGVDVREDIDIRWRSDSQSPKPARLPMVVVSGSANNDPSDRDSGMFAVDLEIELMSNLLADEDVIQHHAQRLVIWGYIQALLCEDTGAYDASSVGITSTAGELAETSFNVTIHV